MQKDRKIHISFGTSPFPCPVLSTALQYTAEQGPQTKSVTNRWRCDSCNRSITPIFNLCHKVRWCLSLCFAAGKGGISLKSRASGPGVVVFFTSLNLCQMSRAALRLRMTLCNYLIHTWSPYRLDKGQHRLSAEACESRAAECMYCKYDSPPLNPNSC